MARTVRSHARRWRILGSLALGAITLALAAPDASAQPVIPFKSREIQPGRKFSQLLLAAPGISESSGQLTYGYPIEIPAGRGVTPTLVLEYSSSAGPSEFGYGWDLTVPTIERTQRNGITDYVEDLYRYKNGHSIAEVVPTGVTTPGGGVEYRERVERSFNRYLRFGDRWIIQTPNGVRLELGTTRASRRGKAIGTGLAGTAAWLVDRIIDTNNNYAQFEYAADSLRNAQLRWVRYNGNAGTNLLPGISVELVWESHFGPGEAVPWHRSGYPRVFGDQRLASVVVRAPKHAGNSSTLSPETRTTRFTYASPTLTSDRVFYLESAGIDGFPPVRFEYSRFQLDGPLDEPLILPVFDLAFPNLIGKQVSSSGGETTTITVADATGDAIPDIVGACHPSSGFWTIWANDGRRLVPTRLATPDDLLAPHRMPDPCALRRQVGGDTVQDFFDLDGDGAPDVVYIGGSQIYYCPGRGRSGFAACEAYTGGGPSAPGFAFLRRVDSSITNVFLTTQDLVDFDGDGRVDILRTSSGVLEFFRNIGPRFGFAPAVSSPAPACPYPFLLPCLRASENFPGPNENRRQLADLRDVNGDGLPDYIASDYQTAAISVAYGTGGANGTGAAFSTSNSMGISIPFGVGTQSGSDYRATTDLVDVNADALPDLVTMNCATSTLTVRYNNGRRWDSTARSYSVSSRPFYRSACLTLQEPDGTTIETHSSFGDFSGDGIPDFLSVLSFEGLIPTIHLRRTHYAAPRRLVAIRSLSGNNVATIEYRARVPSKQVPVHTVASLTRKRTPLYAGEPARATTQQTHFGYGEPAYDAAERTFMGFGSVGASMTLGSPAAPVDGTFTSTVFHTDLPRQGLVAQRLHTNARASGAFDSVLNFYTPVTLAANRTWSRLDRTLQTPDFVQYTAKLLTSYDAFGNPLTWTSAGFWSDPADDIQFHREFRTRSDDQYTVNVPVEEYSVERGSRGSRTRYFYDSPVFGATPTKGNLVRVERERDPGTFIARSFFYNPEGNVSRELDEMNYLTRYAYDSTYRLYRSEISDSVGTITRSYHALNGIVAEECGPQFLGASRRCSRVEVDVLGRPTETWVPTLSGGVYTPARLSTVTYNDFVYPLQAQLVKRGTSRTLEYTDGFGNVTELRVEEAAQFRVWETTFDPLGKPLRQELARRESTPWFTHATKPEAWVYDHDYVNGSIERITHPRDSATAPHASATRIVGGFAITATDEEGFQTKYQLDGHRRVAYVDRSKNGTVARTQFSRDTAGFVSVVTDPVSLVTSYSRNLLGWIYGVTTPDQSSWVRRYTDRGQLATSIDPRGTRVRYTYDAPGRLISIASATQPAGIRPVNATIAYYDASSSTQIGWKKSEASDGITQTFTYSAEGLVSSMRSQFGAHAGTVAFTYAIGGRLGVVVYPDGYTTTYAHNLDDSVQAVTAGGSVLGSYVYGDDGQPTAITNQLGLRESSSYDARGRLVAVTSTNTSVPGGNLVDDTITLSPSSLVTRMDHRGLKPNLVPRVTVETDVISYDDLSRLKGVTGGKVGAYVYDLSGKLTSFRDGPKLNSSSTTFSSDRLIQRVTITGADETITDKYVYDASGNVTSDARTATTATLNRSRIHKWDALNRYVRTDVDGAGADDGFAEYYYSPSSKLTRVVSPGQGLAANDVLYIGPWARKDATAGTWTDTILANGAVLGESTGPRFEMPHRTTQQTVAAVSNDLGQVIRQEEFTPYGARAAGASSGRHDFHFQGMRSDELAVAGTRAYDPAAGIWLGRDKLVLDGPDSIVSEPRLAEMYAFDFGTPYTHRDPSGRNPIGGPGIEMATPSMVDPYRRQPGLEGLQAASAAQDGPAYMRAQAHRLAGRFETTTAHVQWSGQLFAIAVSALSSASFAVGQISLANGMLSGIAGARAFVPPRLGVGGPRDPAYDPTVRGGPSWRTVQRRFWKSEAQDPHATENYGAANVARMQRGDAPQRYNPLKGDMESMELSHEPVSKRDGGRAFVPRWPEDHAAVDSFRRTGY